MFKFNLIKYNQLIEFFDDTNNDDTNNDNNNDTNNNIRKIIILKKARDRASKLLKLLAIQLNTLKLVQQEAQYIAYRAGQEEARQANTIVNQEAQYMSYIKGQQEASYTNQLSSQAAQYIAYRAGQEEARRVDKIIYNNLVSDTKVYDKSDIDKLAASKMEELKVHYTKYVEPILDKRKYNISFLSSKIANIRSTISVIKTIINKFTTANAHINALDMLNIDDINVQINKITSYIPSNDNDNEIHNVTKIYEEYNLYNTKVNSIYSPIIKSYENTSIEINRLKILNNAYQELQKIQTPTILETELLKLKEAINIQNEYCNSIIEKYKDILNTLKSLLEKASSLIKGNWNQVCKLTNLNNNNLSMECKDVNGKYYNMVYNLKNCNNLVLDVVLENNNFKIKCADFVSDTKVYDKSDIDKLASIKNNELHEHYNKYIRPIIDLVDDRKILEIIMYYENSIKRILNILKPIASREKDTSPIKIINDMDTFIIMDITDLKNKIYINKDNFDKVLNTLRNRYVETEKKINTVKLLNNAYQELSNIQPPNILEIEISKLKETVNIYIESKNLFIQDNEKRLNDFKSLMEMAKKEGKI